MIVIGPGMVIFSFLPVCARASLASVACTRPFRRNSWGYHLAGPLGLGRNMVLRALGGENLLRRYDWLYEWTPQK